MGTLNLIKCCKSSNIKYFVFSSSCSIYGNTIGAVSEKRRPNPKSYYADGITEGGIEVDNSVEGQISIGEDDNGYGNKKIMDKIREWFLCTRH